MKIKSHTPNLLVVEDAPWALGLFAILMMLLCAAMAVASTALGSSLLWPMLACIAFFAACFVLLVRRNQLVMDRGSGVVELRQKSLFGYRAVRHELSEISRAEVETRKNWDGQVFSRMYLVIEHGQSAGDHPFPRAFRKWSAPSRTAEVINQWLANPPR